MSKVKDIKTLKQVKGGEAALGSNSSLNLLHQQSMDRASSALSISDADVESMDFATVKSRLMLSLKELSNRDTTVRALQRNYETLCTSFEAMKDQHAQRKDAYDEILVKLAQSDKFLGEEKNTNAALRARGQQLDAAAADAAERERLSRAECAAAKGAADKAELEKKLAVGSLEKEREEVRKLKQQLDETRVKLKAAQSDFDAAIKGNGNVHERMQALQTEVADKTKQLQMRDNQLAVAREGAAELAVERDALRRQLAESRQHLEREQQQVRTMLDAAVNKFREEEVRYQRLCAEQKKNIDELQQGVASEQQTAQQLAADLQAKMDALKKHEEQIGAQQQQLLTASASVAELERLQSAGAGRVQQLIDEVASLSKRLECAGKESQRLAAENSSQTAQIGSMKTSIALLQSNLDRSVHDAAALSTKLQQLEAAASAAKATADSEAQLLGGRVTELQLQVLNQTLYIYPATYHFITMHAA
jgi:chromosome segregation ATPase